jgi:ATP-binding cassette subfamily F protein uup
MALLTLLDAQLAYGDFPLLDRAAFSMESGERIGLIGRNGTGKSSLLTVIAGTSALDDGELRKSESLRIAFVEQEPKLPHAPTLRASLLLRGHIPSIHDERERWQVEARLTEFLHRLGLDEELSPDAASGGEKKRAALALAFALQPELLLLDEPTNHLDISGIEQLETLLLRQQAAIVVTHDRAFLDRVCTRILELDRGMLRSFPGNYSAYEAVKESQLAAEATAQRKFDKFWKEEEIWIRKGVEARRTRNEARAAPERLGKKSAPRGDRLGSGLSLSAGQLSGKLVAG